MTSAFRSARSRRFDHRVAINKTVQRLLPRGGTTRSGQKTQTVFTKTLRKTEYGAKLPNITNSIDVLNINTSVINDSIVNGINTNTIAVIPTDNLTRSYPVTFEPRRPLYCPVSSFNIAEMRMYVTDSLGRPVNFNGIDWFLTLRLHSMYYNSINKMMRQSEFKMKQGNLQDSIFTEKE